MQIKQKLGHNSFILLKYYANYLMELSKSQPRGNNRHCLERFPSVSNPHLTLHPVRPVFPLHTLRLLRSLSGCSACCAWSQQSSPPPHPAPPPPARLPSPTGLQPLFSGRSHAMGEPALCLLGPARRPRVPRGPAARSLPHYPKPLCLHFVGAVISEVSGAALRSLLK